MNELVESLQRIGLSDKEAKIYLALLKIGDATVKNIASEADVKRPTTYLILEELRKKGLLLKIPHTKKAIYRAKSPDDLHSFAVENIETLERVLPKIESITGERNPVKTLYFEGLQGLKDALNYKNKETENKTMTVFWAKLDKVSKPVLEIFKKSHNALIKNKVTVTGITPEDETGNEFRESYPADLYKVTTLPKNEYSSDISLEVVENFLRIINGVEMKAVIIEDKSVADSMRQIFNIVKKQVGKV